MKYDVEFTNKFKKELKIAKKQNKDLNKLYNVIEKLANGETLDIKYRETHECHIEPDWLLVYEIKDEILVLILYRINSHSELF